MNLSGGGLDVDGAEHAGLDQARDVVGVGVGGQDRAGKERLQASALAEVQKVMQAETGNKTAEDLLFTSFVTQ